MTVDVWYADAQHKNKKARNQLASELEGGNMKEGIRKDAEGNELTEGGSVLRKLIREHEGRLDMDDDEDDGPGFGDSDIDDAEVQDAPDEVQPWIMLCSIS